MDTRQQQLLEWASVNVREPWEKMVEIASEISLKNPVNSEQACVRVPMAPFTADYRALYPIMKSFGGLITWSPNNLFTIILDAEEKTILRAYVEGTRDHNFTKLIPVDLDEPFLAEALSIIQSGNLYSLRRFLDHETREKYGTRVNWVKIANIEFFGAFADNVTAFDESGDLWDWLDGALLAVSRIYKEDLIRFAPEPPVFARMRNLFAGILNIDPAHLDLRSLFGPIKKDQPGDKEIIVLLTDNQEIAGFSLGGENPMHLTVDPEITNQLQGVPFHKLAKQCAKLTEADHVIVLRTEPVANLVYESLFHEMPYRREDTKAVLRKALEITRRFREQWTMYPLPFYLADWIRLPAKWFGNPFDINYLASWFLPGMIVDGEAVFLGQHSNRTFVTMDQNKIIAMYSIEFYDSGIRRFTTHDPKKYSGMFTDMASTYEDVRERSVQLGIRLWNEGYGFQNQVMITQLDFLKTLGQLNSVSIWKNPFKLFRLIGPIRRLMKLGKAGAIVSYPDKMLVALEDWIKRVGRLHIYSNILFIPFDRRRPRYRGLKYIKETLIALVIMAVILIAIFT